MSATVAPEVPDPISRLGAGLLAAVLVVLGVLLWSHVSSPFGDSDEGTNAAVWGLDSRALRELGPVESALGGRRADGTRYATHPPLIVLTAASAELVAGEREWASRAPAWIATAAAAFLLRRLLREQGLSEGAATGAAVFVVLTPMVSAYGWMLDTPVTSFPFGVWCLLLWQRDWPRAGPRHTATPNRAVTVVAVCAVAALSGWLAALAALGCGGTLLISGLRSRGAALRRSLLYLVGGTLGLGLSIAWSLWVHGGVEALRDKLTRRTGSAGGVGPLDVVTFQLPWLAQLLAIGMVALVVCVLALRRPALRSLAAMSLALPVGYALLFREAAAGHQYWLYWLLLPTALGAGVAIDAALTQIRASSSRLDARAALLAGVGLAVLGALPGIIRGTDATAYIDGGLAGQRLAMPVADRLGDPVRYIGEEARPDPWINYYLRRPAIPLRSRADVERLAADHPDQLLLLLTQCGEGDPSRDFCDDALRRSGTLGAQPMLLTPREVLDRLAVP